MYISYFLVGLDCKYFSHTKLCYSLNLASTTWDDARRSCQGVIGVNGDLATIADQETMDFIAKNFELEGDTWFGGEKVLGEWKWADGTLWNYTNWDSEEPDNDDATYLRPNNEGWYDYHKTYNSHHYICQYSFIL